MMRKTFFILLVSSVVFSQMLKPTFSEIIPNLSDGLATNAIVQMAISSDSTKLWLGTTGGISFVNLKDESLPVYSLDVGRL